MDILILGGSGTIGSWLQKLLLEDHNNYLCVTSRKERISRGNVQYIMGNPHDLSFVKKLTQKKWHCIIDFMTYSLAGLEERIDYYLSATDQYIFLSSARVYSNSSEPLTETSNRLLDVCQDSRYLSTNEYALEKAREEDLFISSQRDNWTIVRPYITYGVEKYQLGCFEKEEWLYRVIHGRSLVFSHDLVDHVTTMTSYKDVAKGIYNLIGKQDALQNIYQIASPVSYTWGAVLNIYRNVLEKLLNHPVNVVFAQDSDSLIRNDSWYQLHYDRYFDRFFNSCKIKGINTIEYTDFETGIKECLEVFLKNPNFGKIDWKTEVIKDRLSGDKTPLYEIKGIKTKIKYFLYRYMNVNLF